MALSRDYSLRALPGILPCGARTFLTERSKPINLSAQPPSRPPSPQKIIYSQHFPISRAYSTSHTYYLFHCNVLTHIFIYLLYTKISKRIFNFVDITKYFQNRHFYTIWFYLKKIISNQYFPYI